MVSWGQLREDAGFGVRELGRALGVGHTTIWRYESGLKPPTPEEAASVLTAMGVKGDHKDRIIGDARAVRDPNWLTALRCQGAHRPRSSSGSETDP